MRTFEEIKLKADQIYLRWLLNGAHEADDELNSANRELISVFKEKYPDALGYKMYNGFIELSENTGNFGVDFIFRKNEEMMKEVEKENDIIKKLDIFEKHKAIAVIWS
ncbi:hypothetical protein [Ruminococcus albus]|uniref:Conserved domain protein n=1 Tax=Ruminococcus albus 8 TaxID=246199 RepID=E9S8B3_RUMAL|nr:hypothetical protein [Ruminococcus albus]EGC04474.1 conserved domain protein [Ruminococcus albus 8]MCC3351803.1 hypothetical protein [Ruminococcus albus 8]